MLTFAFHRKDACPPAPVFDMAGRRARGLPVVLDEVFSGLWRLGAISAAERLGIQPDVACYAKLLTGARCGGAIMSLCRRMTIGCCSSTALLGCAGGSLAAPWRQCLQLEDAASRARRARSACPAASQLADAVCGHVARVRPRSGSRLRPSYLPRQLRRGLPIMPWVAVSPHAALCRWQQCWRARTRCRAIVNRARSDAAPQRRRHRSPGSHAGDGGRV